MASELVQLDQLIIAPFETGMTKGVFSTPDPEFENLVHWYKVMAMHSQRDKKSKTYVAMFNERVVGYVSVSIGHLKTIEGVKPLTKSFEFQVLNVGKLYVEPSARSLGIGKRLMDFSLGIAQNIDEMIGCVGVIVDANTNEKTVNFYTRYGFEKIAVPEGKTVKMFCKLAEGAIIPK